MKTDKKTDIKISEQKGVTLITFAAASVTNTKKINKAAELINDYIQENQPRFAVVDFTNVKFFSSQVLGVILNIRKRLKDNNGKVAISAIDPQLYRVFRITNLDKIFEFYDSKEDALKALKEN